MSETPSPIECARLYLSPSRRAFWRWSEDRTAVEWSDGGTILLREEVVSFLEHRVQAGRGAPPFQSIVFLVALLRDRERALAGEPADAVPPTEHLWRCVRGRPDLRLALFECALHPAPVNQAAFAAAVAHAMRGGVPPETLDERDFDAFDRSAMCSWLRVGLRGLTAERLELLVQAGVADVPAARAETVEPPLDGASLLRRLDDDPEHGGLADVARQVMAAMRVPAPASLRDELPIGGFAGVTNCGSLDRLLVSELAQDDTVLALRIATGQALYAQRESPPRTPAQHWRILLDTGLRTWGTSRILGVAVALALRAKTAPDAEVDVYTTAGADGTARVDLATRAGIGKQLGRLDNDLDARRVVADFLATAPPTDRAVTVENVLVVAADSVRDAEFRVVVRPTGSARVLVAETGEAGRFRLLAVTARGWESVAQAELDVRGLQLLAEGRSIEFYRRAPPPLTPVTKAHHASREVVAIACVDGSFGVMQRRGWSAVLQLDTAGKSVQWLRARLVDAVPFAPCHDDSGAKHIAVAVLGERWLAYCDGRSFLHFVSRAAGRRQLSVRLSFGASVEGWCSVDGEIAGRRLAERLAAIAEEVTS